MRITAIMPVRSEAWVLGLSARAVLKWADDLIILDHCSTDNSRLIELDVANEHPGRVHLAFEDSPVWEEMRHRQALLDMARKRGATHIAIVDADEVLTGNLLGTIRNTIGGMQSNRILQLPWVCLSRGIDEYYANGVWFNNWVTCAFQDSPALFWRHRDGYDFHHRHPMGAVMTPYQPVQQFPDHGGGLMHLQFVSERRLRAKQRLYKMIEVTRWPGREPVSVVDERYNLAVYQSDPRRYSTRYCNEEWWTPYRPLMRYLDLFAEPWQEAEAQRLIDQYGKSYFAGLDLFY